MSTTKGKHIVRTVCGMPDYLKCGLSVEVIDGAISKIRPADFPDPVDKGACVKGLAVSELVSHPDRLRYPLKRVGARGSGKWQRISWDEAMDSIAAKLQEITKEYGSSSVAWMTSAWPSLAGGGYSRLISLTQGTWVDWWGCGDAAGPCADMATFGMLMGEGCLQRFEDPRFSIVWGYNPALTVHTYMRKITSARRKGGRLVVIDPRFSETAAHADEHIPIRLGTDGALALGMLHVILKQKLEDKRFIVEHTVGPLLVRSDTGLFLRESDLVDGGSQHRFMVFDENSGREQPCDASGVSAALTGVYSIRGIECRPAYELLAGLVRDYSPEYVSEITDVPADVIQRLAISYATQKPAAIYRGWGVQRSFYGDLNCRAINTLAAVTGNVSLKRPSSFALNTRPFMMPGGPYSSVPVLMLHDAVGKGEPFPVRAVWCAFHNFVNQMPNTNRVINELVPNLEFIVVCDLFMTASARYADYVLPVASFLECTDVTLSSFQNVYLQLQQKVVEPIHESKSDFQIAAELGRRMGFGDHFNKSEEEYIEELLGSGHPSMQGVSLDRLRQGPIMADSSDRVQQWKTSTGRIEFYVEELKEFGQELPIYLEPVESTRTELARRYPLSLLSTHPVNRVHSTLATNQTLLKLDPEPTLEINPTDAERRGISDGELVRVFNDRGQVKVKARLSQGIKPGVVNIIEGWWPEQYVEGHCNELAHDRINPAQQHIFQPNAAFFDILVEVENVQV
ncbi:MAG: molybdopterin-dependent oxidoreductase [Chloroflexi bacterium]|nr:molybdopterin-dependent oxidoreductase [Chloroflexota bacterium]